jgi:hypothetical protein
MRYERDLVIVDVKVDGQTGDGRRPSSGGNDNHFRTKFYLAWFPSWCGNHPRKSVDKVVMFVSITE